MFPIRFKNRNYGRLSFQFARKFVFGAIFAYYLFDKILTKIVEKNVNLKPGNFERGLYENLPFPLTLKVYIFNVTNKNEVHNGAKPHLQEIGPYYFDEHIWKSNVSDDDTDDTMTFTLMRKYVFRSDLSNNLTGDEIVTTLHPAINEIFHKPTDAFWTGRAMDLLADGIDIDCSTSNPLAKLACSEMRKTKNPAIQQVTKTHLKFSLLAGNNNTANGRFKVIRGTKNIRHAGQVVEVDGQTEMTVWGTEGSCNQIVGTDGLLFRPLQPKQEPVSFFIKQICSSLHLTYQKAASFRGIDTHIFIKEFEDFATNENLSCFCRRPNECPVWGTMDLMPCVQAPITISLPHFYKADPSLLANVASGLRPTKEIHDFFLNLELTSGVPVKGAGRVQVNFEVEPVQEIEIMAKLPKMIFPWVWFDEYANIPDWLIGLLKYTLTLAITINRFIKWMTMTYWLFGTLLCTMVFCLHRFTNVDILEKENLFTKSPAKVEPMKIVDESSIKDITEKNLGSIEMNGVNNTIEPKSDRVSILFDEIVTKAASAAANRSNLQTNFNQTKE